MWHGRGHRTENCKPDNDGEDPWQKGKNPQPSLVIGSHVLPLRSHKTGVVAVLERKDNICSEMILIIRGMIIMRCIISFHKFRIIDFDKCGASRR
jgi:hypothetical protein